MNQNKTNEEPNSSNKNSDIFKSTLRSFKNRDCLWKHGRVVTLCNTQQKTTKNTWTFKHIIEQSQTWETIYFWVDLPPVYTLTYSMNQTGAGRRKTCMSCFFLNNNTRYDSIVHFHFHILTQIQSITYILT